MSRTVPHHETLHGSNPVFRVVRDLINKVGPFRRIVKSKPAQNLIYTARVAAEVRDPIQFVRDQLSERELITVVKKGSEATVVLRRRSGDLVMFHQVLGRDSYDPPAKVASALGGGSELKIADLGANVGMFTVSMLNHFPGSKIIAFEADPANARVFEKTIAANDWGETVDLRPVAAMTEDGDFELAGGDFFQSRVRAFDEGSSTIVAGVDVLPLLADRDLIKIDIEGSEWPILADPRFGELPARALAMEWHLEGCPAPEPLAEVERMLLAVGFEFEHEFIDDDCGTLWAWKPGDPGAVS